MRARLLAVTILVGGIVSGGPACVQASLTSYVNLGAGGCNVGDLRYFNFVFAVNPNGFEASDQILVTPTLAVTSSTLGFSQFTSAGLNTSVTYFINYSVDPPPIMAGERVVLDPPIGNDIGIFNVCINQLFQAG